MKKRWFLALCLLLLAPVPSGCGSEPAVPGLPAPGPAVVPEQEVIKRVEPVMVVVDNYSKARPQSGLQEATIVYEFLAEGGVTRFLAVYDRLLAQDVIVGPIRSMRTHLAAQAKEHGKIVAHSGYSAQTEQQVRSLGIKEITGSTHLFRDSARRAPHNLYTSLERLASARGSAVVQAETVTESRLPDGYELANSIEISYNSQNMISYQFDAERGVYLRFINGIAHQDRETEEQYSAYRVIVRSARHVNVPGTALVEIDLTGAGHGLLYQAGRKYEIRWEKSDRKTRYFYQDGAELDLRFNNTWIQIIS
ncbi:MAG: putative lipoprotein YerB [Syntrophomonadaceae bacterium]|nr:putative lipoprotein YerB [Bacillota bacterium]